MDRLNRRIRFWPAAVFLAVALLPGCAPGVFDLAARGDAEHLDTLLTARPEALDARDRLGKTPLHFAVTFGHAEVAAVLVEHGADLNAADGTGMTPLHVAAMMCNKNAADWLAGRGADVNARDDFGDTPLHTAALFDAGDVAEKLLERGADARAANKAGRTAFDLARERGFSRIMLLLKKWEARHAGDQART